MLLLGDGLPTPLSQHTRSKTTRIGLEAIVEACNTGTQLVDSGLHELSSGREHASTLGFNAGRERVQTPGHLPKDSIQDQTTLRRSARLIPYMLVNVEHRYSCFRIPGCNLSHYPVNERGKKERRSRHVNNAHSALYWDTSKSCYYHYTNMAGRIWYNSNES